MALAALEAKEQDLVVTHKVDPETAHRMVWDTDADLTNEEG